MKQLVDIDNWKRKENYLFFRNFANPYYTVTSVVDVSKAYDTSKRLGIKFSQFLMYASLKAVNEIEFLRYRQIDGRSGFLIRSGLIRQYRFLITLLFQ